MENISPSEVTKMQKHYAKDQLSLVLDLIDDIIYRYTYHNAKITIQDLEDIRKEIIRAKKIVLD